MDWKEGCKKRTWAFVLAVLLALQCTAFPVCSYGDDLRETGEPAPASQLVRGDHILLGKDPAGAEGAFGGYDFTVLDAGEEYGPTGAASGQKAVLLLLSDPMGLEQTPQQFDAAYGGHPDEDSQLDGYNCWTESDLYIALNGSTRAGDTTIHSDQVAAAGRFFQRLRSAGEEWDALLGCGTGGSDGEKVSLLSEEEFETYRGELDPGFWYTESQDDGFWLKTARSNHSNQVRYIYSNDIAPSMSSEEYYALAGMTRCVRPALRLDPERTAFGAGSGTREDPYSDLILRPAVEGLEAEGSPRVGETLTLSVSPAAASCEYQWYLSRDIHAEFEAIAAATGPAYTPGPEDVAMILRATARGKGEFVGRAEITVGPVDKGEQEAPSGDQIPTAQGMRITDCRIQVDAPAEGMEYALTTGSAAETRQPGQPGQLDWTSSGAFTSLSAVTSYDLYVRWAELPAYYASPAAGPVTVTTKDVGAEMTLTVQVRGFNPQTAATVSLVRETGENGGTAAAVTLTAVSTTDSAAGVSLQTVSLSGIAMDQPYSLEIRKPGHLPFRQRELRLTEDTLWEIRLPCGDVNGDGSIDLKDRQLLLLASCFGKEVDTAAGEGAEQAALLDLDGDGRIGLSDLMILMLSENFGKKVPVQ
ncbi:hypothetical protein [Bacilliculturomica massiliensis]|uniref:hypothetical protein n=1 Tax=Bacilliculturomica massiliensis TaxID=1917867 RepID=UPI001031EBBB|nr:hypothetical protein [Bacilliculturomica massiliensis]